MGKDALRLNVDFKGSWSDFKEHSKSWRIARELDLGQDFHPKGAGPESPSLAMELMFEIFAVLSANHLDNLSVEPFFRPVFRVSASHNSSLAESVLCPPREWVSASVEAKALLWQAGVGDQAQRMRNLDELMKACAELLENSGGAEFKSAFRSDVESQCAHLEAREIAAVAKSPRSKSVRRARV